LVFFSRHQPVEADAVELWQSNGEVDQPTALSLRLGIESGPIM